MSRLCEIKMWKSNEIGKQEQNNVEYFKNCELRFKQINENEKKILNYKLKKTL